MRTSSLRRPILWLLAATSLPGCPAPIETPTLDAGPPSDIGSMDAPGTDAPDEDASESDAPRPDGASACVGASDCDDGLFCNGVEACVASACAAGSSPCPGASCNEGSDRCGCIDPDMDGDGADAMACGGTDCDDTNANRAPGRPEVCDVADLDEDCDPSTYGFRDLDGDSFSDLGCCNQDAAGAMVCGRDCDDMRPATSPVATEACNGIDDDCDGSMDEGTTAALYLDADRDGFGTGAVSTRCADSTGYSPIDGDCNDGAASVHPGATEICNGVDDDCVGGPDDVPGGCACVIGSSQACGTDTGACVAGTQSCAGGTWGPCMGETIAFPEVCNAIDDDCDGPVDEGVTPVTCWPDGDNDTYALTITAATSRCPDPARSALGFCPVNFTNRDPAPVGDSDCVDTNPAISPAITEMCSTPPVDQNCNGNADEGFVNCYADSDADGYAATGAPVLSSGCPTSGGFGGCGINLTSRDPSTAGNADCNATDPTVHPTAAETCNAVDDDCDTATDEDFLVVYYRDEDGDGFGGSTASVMAPSCGMPAGYVTSSTDCCDTDRDAFPGQTMYYFFATACGGYDFDCNGTISHRGTALGSNCGCGGGRCFVSTSECYAGAPPACGTDVERCSCSGTFTSCSPNTCGTNVAGGLRLHACR